jgi:hypothetical protein
MAGVTLCAIMKNEYFYILEWIAYHRLLGFDRIVIYSNDSTDGSVDLLNALARCGVIAHWLQPTGAGVSPQHAAYAHAIRTCETEWIGFLDADEFLVLKEDETVQDFLARFDAEVSAVAVNWRMFGSSGRRTYEPGLVIERFTRATDKDHSVNTHFKSFVRAERVARMAVHNARLKSGDYVNASGEPIERENIGRSKGVDTRRAQVNHYCVKSREEFEWKRARGFADRALGDPVKSTARQDSFFDFHDRNECEDLTLFARREEVGREIDRLVEAMRATGFLVFR